MFLYTEIILYTRKHLSFNMIDTRTVYWNLKFKSQVQLGRCAFLENTLSKVDVWKPLLQL